MTKWIFIAGDNSGKRQYFTVAAPSKTEAIRKGYEKARKNASGDIVTWDCKLKTP